MNIRTTWTASLVSNSLFTGVAVLLDLYEGSEKDLGFSILVVLCWILASVFWALLHFKCWQSLPAPYAKLSPEKAVGFLFIPFYNFYWAFLSFPELAKGFNEHSRAERQPVRDGYGLAIAMAVLFVAGLTLGFIPGVASLIALGSLVIFILYYRIMVANAEAEPSAEASAVNFPPDMPPPPTPPAVPIYLFYGGERRGPFTSNELSALQGLPVDTLYWTAGADDWKPLASRLG